MGLVPQCSSRQEESPDMQHDHFGHTVTLTWRDLRSNFKIDLSRIKKHMGRSSLTRGTRWCQAWSSSLGSLEGIHEKIFPQKTIFLSLVTSRTYSIRLTVNLRAQIDSGDPGLSFDHLIILLASIVIEIIAIFCENSPTLRKIDLFYPL